MTQLEPYDATKAERAYRLFNDVWYAIRDCRRMGLEIEPLPCCLEIAEWIVGHRDPKSVDEIRSYPDEGLRRAGTAHLLRRLGLSELAGDFLTHVWPIDELLADTQVHTADEVLRWIARRVHVDSHSMQFRLASPV